MKREKKDVKSIKSKEITDCTQKKRNYRRTHWGKKIPSKHILLKNLTKFEKITLLLSLLILIIAWMVSIRVLF